LVAALLALEARQERTRGEMKVMSMRPQTARAMGLWKKMAKERRAQCGSP
jgi:hypothetical protein